MLTMQREFDQKANRSSHLEVTPELDRMNESGKSCHYSVDQFRLCDSVGAFGYLLNHVTHTIIHRFAIKRVRGTNVRIKTSCLTRDTLRIRSGTILKNPFEKIVNYSPGLSF